MARIPRFHDPRRIGTLFYPDVSKIAAQAARAGLPPASEDLCRTHLLIVDMQVDFCHERGALHVPGAKEDLARLIEFIYRRAESITSITCSLDSHLPHQIFTPSWWSDARGRQTPAFTIVTRDDLDQGIWRPRREPAWSRRYLRRLERTAKKALTIWPYHVPIGGVGQALDPELWSAVFWHALARESQPTFWTKGSNPKTEHYSLIRPEIPVSSSDAGGRGLLRLLRSQDRIIVAGEAASHCVLETLEDLVEEFGGQPRALRRLCLLRDCTSPVAHPRVDFAALTEKRFAEFERMGIRFIKSGDPAAWSDLLRS